MQRVALFAMFVALAVSLAPVHCAACCALAAHGSAGFCCVPARTALHTVCCMPASAMALPSRSEEPVVRSFTACRLLVAGEEASEILRRAVAVLSVSLPQSPPRLVLRI
jgi:hypothetical protein